MMGKKLEKIKEIGVFSCGGGGRGGAGSGGWRPKAIQNTLLRSNVLKQTYSFQLRLKDASLFKHVWPFCYHQALKGSELKSSVIEIRER